jgi:hypothetical protein
MGGPPGIVCGYPRRRTSTACVFLISHLRPAIGLAHATQGAVIDDKQAGLRPEKRTADACGATTTLNLGEKSDSFIHRGSEPRYAE